MARIVIVTSQVPGNVLASAEFARRLKAPGHDVTFASPYDIGPILQSRGVTFHRLGQGSVAGLAGGEKPDVARRAAAFVFRIRQIRTISERRRARVDALGLDEFEDALADLRPDLVILDMELPHHIMSACSLDIPVGIWTPHMSLWKRSRVPPLHTYTMPGSGWQGSTMGIEWAWLSFRVREWLRSQRHRITRVGEDSVSVLRATAARVGFPFRQGLSLHQWFRPAVFRSLTLISFNAWEFEFPHDRRPTSQYVGPMIRPLERLGGDRERLAAIADRRNSDEGRRLIYCSFGTWHPSDDREFLRRVVAAVADHPDWDLVVGLGGRTHLGSLGDLPPNVHLFEFAPQLQILEMTDCAINHAGINSVNECIYSGSPMILYPFDFIDQPGTAARVAYHGLGVVGDRENDSSETISERIEGILANEQMSRRVHQMQRAFRRYDEENTAAETVEALL